MRQRHPQPMHPVISRPMPSISPPSFLELVLPRARDALPILVNGRAIGGDVAGNFGDIGESYAESFADEDEEDATEHVPFIETLVR